MKRKAEKNQRGNVRKNDDVLHEMFTRCRMISRSAVRLARLMRGNPRAAAAVPLRDIAHMLSVTSGAGRTYANILKGSEAHNGD